MLKSFPIILASSLLFFLTLFVPYSQHKATKSKMYAPAINNAIAITPVPKQPKALIGNISVNLEIADSPEEWNIGLSLHEYLEAGSGMLFIFDSKDVRPTFWMKDMSFPIDILWINDGSVIGIEENAPPPEPGTPDNKLVRYAPEKPIDYVLEVNAGFSQANNIVTGTTIEFINI